MTHMRRSLRRIGAMSAVAVCALAASWSAASAQTTTLNICYMNHPVQVTNVGILEKHAKAQGVILNKAPVSYAVYLPKITQMLSAGASDQCDIIWNNDDWGQDFAEYLVPMDDVPEVNNVAENQLRPFLNSEGKPTTVSITTTAGIFYYRKDLIPENQVPKTWAELTSLSQKLQSEGKVRWGFVGGMSYTNTFFSFFWTLWNNDCDVYSPAFSRDMDEVTKAGWKPMLDSACQKQTAEFWWDALNKDKISPPGMTTYSRDEANAIFQAGEAAFTVADTVFLGQFNDPRRSKVAGNIGVAQFPQGPSSKGPRTWIDIWGWSIPKAIPAEKQAAAKKLIAAMIVDEEGQIDQWNKTGGPPPNTRFWKTLDKSDALWRQVSSILYDTQHAYDAYYFRNWAAVHKNYSDTLIRAMKGDRDDIAATLASGVQAIHDGAPK